MLSERREWAAATPKWETTSRRWPASARPTNKTGSSVVQEEGRARQQDWCVIADGAQARGRAEDRLRAARRGASRLRTLDLSRNKLDKLPEQWNFPKLTTCNLSQNRLTRLPELGQALKKLDASENRLTDVVSCLTNAEAHLEELSLSKNPSLGTGNLWPAVALLTRLTLLDVCGCGLRSLLDGSFSLPELIDLRADDNLIEEIDVATKAPALRRLSLARNRLQAQGIPTSLLRLSSLSHLDLQGNPLTKRQFLDIPGCDDFLKRREEHRKKQGGEFAELGVCGLDDPAPVVSTRRRRRGGAASRRRHRRDHVKFATFVLRRMAVCPAQGTRVRCHSSGPWPWIARRPGGPTSREMSFAKWPSALKMRRRLHSESTPKCCQSTFASFFRK